MLAFKGPAQPALTPCQLSGCIHLGQLASKHRDRGQEIAASVSQVSRNDRVGRVGDIEIPVRFSSSWMSESRS